MKNEKFDKIALIAGGTLFSSMLDSGNIIFSIMTGKICHNHYIIAYLGWILSAVVLTFVGCYVSMLYDADNDKLLKPIGKYPTQILIGIIMFFTGPFCIMARNVTISSDYICNIFTYDSVIFKLFYCVLLVLTIWHPSKVIDILGKVFTPVKIFGILIIVILAILLREKVDLPASTITDNLSLSESFSRGIVLGYQTTDMLDAFVTMNIIYTYLNNNIGTVEPESKKRLILAIALRSFLLASGIFIIVYWALIYLGVQYSYFIKDVVNSVLLQTITAISLGHFASIFISLLIPICCFATNVGLGVAFVNYLHKILNEKINKKILTILVGTTTFTFSLLGFDTIFTLCEKIITMLYPLLIIIIVYQGIKYIRK